MVGKIPDATPEKDDSSTHEKRFEAFLPDLEPGIAMMKEFFEEHVRNVFLHTYVSILDFFLQKIMKKLKFFPISL